MKTDICILGGGIMGLATAYSICKRSDRQVLVLDRYGVGNEYCSSKDVNRVFRYSYGNDELYVKMAVESLVLWHQLEKESGQELLIKSGLLLLRGEDRNANSFNEASYNTLSRMNLETERLDKDELEKRFPQFRAQEAFLDSHGGILLASKAIETLRKQASTHGVKFKTGHATRIVTGDPSHVATNDDESIEFRKLVITVGSWSNNLLTGRTVSINPTRQQLIYFRPANLDRFRPRNCPVFFTDMHYGIPAGGIDAVKVSAKELDEKVDPETVNRAVDEKQVAECRESCRRFVPEIADGEFVSSKVCLYDMTDNSDFVLDRDPEDSNIVYGYGFSGHGFKFAPLIGKLLASLSLDNTPEFELERFSAITSRRRSPVLGAHLGKSE